MKSVIFTFSQAAGCRINQRRWKWETAGCAEKATRAGRTKASHESPGPGAPRAEAPAGKGSRVRGARTASLLGDPCELTAALPARFTGGETEVRWPPKAEAGPSSYPASLSIPYSLTPPPGGFASRVTHRERPSECSRPRGKPPLSPHPPPFLQMRMKAGTPTKTGQTRPRASSLVAASSAWHYHYQERENIHGV